MYQPTLLYLLMVIVGAIAGFYISNWIHNKIPNKKTFTPKTEAEFMEITKRLESEGITNEDYDNYYATGCTITVVGDRYYTN